MQSMVFISIILLINISLLFATPLSVLYPFDENLPVDHLVKRYQFSPWIHKRNPTLCDYRLQLRPLPLTSALCSYGHSKDKDAEQMNPFKYG